MVIKHKWFAMFGIIAVLATLIFSFSAAFPVAADSGSNKESDNSAADANHWSGHNTFHIRMAATSAPTGLTPAQIRAVYNLPSSGGTGTIAIIDAYDDPTAASDLATFSSQYGLPAPNFEKHMMASTIPVDTGWALEVSLDLQWVHAIAPNAKILLVEATSAYLSDLLNAINYASSRPDVVAVSMSWGGGEFSSEASYDSNFTSPYGARFFASAGDSGAGVSWPAVSPNVIGVGGTTLNFNNGSLTSETAWSGSGGGISAFESEPSYQLTYGVPGVNNHRAVPDVAYDADPNSGVSVYDSTPYSGSSGWFQVGGTSAGAPQWAAIQSLGLSASNANFYQDARSGNAASYFRDITSGSNGHPATAGYDLVTGLGSPLTTNYAAATIPDFTLNASPTSQSVVQGGSTSYSVTINPLNSFTGSVALGLTGSLPAGVSGTFNPISASTSAPSSLSVVTSGATPAGTYTLTISGTSGSLTHSANISLAVTPSGSFTLSASPSNLSVIRGSSIASTITVIPTGGFNGKVNLSIRGLPYRATATFNPNQANTSSTLTINTSSRTYRGSYTLTITGNSGTITKQTTVNLTVN